MASTLRKKLNMSKSKAPIVEIPSELTHYTDLAGLQGIIERRQLWLSHAAFLNDPEELRHGIKRADRVLQKLIKEADGTDASDGRLKLVSDIARDFAKFQPPDAYIACFCRRSDLLSQWRGYASRQGVSVTFSTEGIVRGFTGTGAELHQVAYGINEATQALQSAIKTELPDILNDMDYRVGRLPDKEIRKKFSDLMTRIVPRFKHMGFQEEREWRLLITNPTGTSIKFRPRGALMLPYIELTATTDKLPIEKITIGPGVNDDAVRKSIQFFLSLNGYDPESVQMSSTPYRT